MGVPNGYGKFVYIHAKDEKHKHTFVYMGTFLNGVAHGQGKKLTGKGHRLECDFVNGKPHGFARGFHPGGNLMYEGEYSAGAKTGVGRKYYPNGKRMFEGQMVDG